MARPRGARDGAGRRSPGRSVRRSRARSGAGRDPVTGPVRSRATARSGAGSRPVRARSRAPVTVTEPSSSGRSRSTSCLAASATACAAAAWSLAVSAAAPAAAARSRAACQRTLALGHVLLRLLLAPSGPLGPSRGRLRRAFGGPQRGLRLGQLRRRSRRSAASRSLDSCSRPPARRPPARPASTARHARRRCCRRCPPAVGEGRPAGPGTARRCRPVAPAPAGPSPL